MADEQRSMIWFLQMAQLSTTISKILIRRPNRLQSEGSHTPRPEGDCVPLKSCQDRSI